MTTDEQSRAERKTDRATDSGGADTGTTASGAAAVDFGQVTADEVRRVLGTVTDFDAGEDVVSLGMVSGIAINDDGITVTLDVEPKEARLKEPLRAACEETLAEALDVANVRVVLTGETHKVAPSQTPKSPGAWEDEDLDPERDKLRVQVIEALKQVYDPEIPVSLYELGLIYRVDIREDRSVYVEMTLTTPGCPVAGMMPGEVEQSIRMNTEASDVVVELVWDPPWTMERMSEAAKLELGFF